MNYPTKEAVRAALLAQEAAQKERDSGQGRAKTPRSNGDNTVVPFWDLPVGGSLAARFLPDGDEANLFPWVENQTIELTFDGVVGGERPTSNSVTIKVPCVDMFRSQTNLVFADLEFNTPCPIQAHTRGWWVKQGEPETANSRLARKYWKKRRWIMQGFANQPVDKDGNPFLFKEEAPENPIRRYILGKKIFDKVKKSLTSFEFEDMITDFVGGTDFNIVKSKLGDNNNYDQSEFSRRSRSLSADELGAIEQYGPFTLKEFLPKCPDKDTVDMIYAMFLDSLDSKPFDFDSFGEKFRPYGNRGDSRGGSNGEGAGAGDTGRVTGREQSSGEPEASGSADAGNAPSTADLIARIRGRNGNA